MSIEHAKKKPIWISINLRRVMTILRKRHFRGFFHFLCRWREALIRVEKCYLSLRKHFPIGFGPLRILQFELETPCIFFIQILVFQNQTLNNLNNKFVLAIRLKMDSTLSDFLKFA